MLVRLPFVPEPLPDEILGSWLARLVLLNGSGAWRAFIEDIGYQRKIDSAIFDMPDYSPRFAALIAALGRDYEPAMLALSTLPYWLTFDAIQHETSRLPGMVHTPGFCGRSRRPQSSTRSTGISRSNGHARRPRYCPKCLAADAADHGAAYWHRAHQLPNVLFCHLHQVRLRTTCPYCGLGIVMVAKRLVRLPTPRCSCGADLSQTADHEKPGVAYLTLARLSAEALNLEVPRWDRDQVRSYLRSALRQDGSDRVRQYQGAIEGAFGAWRSANQTGVASTLARSAQHQEFRLRFDFSSAQAPECCAVMAALNLEFAEVIPEFINASTQWQRGGVERVTADAWDVQRAKEELSRRCAKQPGLPPSVHRRPYWYLRLNDPEWLLQAFPSVLLERIPDVQADRAVLQSLAAEAAHSVQRRRTLLSHCPAGLRAVFRDRSWFDGQLAALRSQGTQSLRVRRADTTLERLQALKDALQAMMASSERPVRIFATSLAFAAGLSHSQAGDVIRKFPELKAAIAAANADKHRRQALWAARQLRAQGQPLSHKTILKKASLPTLAVNYKLARAAVAVLMFE